MYLNSGRRKYGVMSQMHCAQPTMYKFFCFKIKIKTKVDSYMPCKAMAHSTKLDYILGTKSKYVLLFCSTEIIIHCSNCIFDYFLWLKVK